MATADARLEADRNLADFVADHYADPLGFVLNCYRWPINGEDGPDVWQMDALDAIGQQVRAHRFDGSTPVLPIRMGTSSGHGIGKSALSAWIVNWIMSTRPYARGTITANTNDQLEKKTWAAVREWTKHCLTAHWFEINSAIMYRRGCRESWFCAPQSCAEENSEAFAGQHTKASTSFYIFDEASAIPDVIWDVAEGGLTDGEPMIFAWGNPTRNTGKFHQHAFGSTRDRWTIRVIDSRSCKFSNKALIDEWATDYGEDSDFFRVRVRGLPPNADELQFIDGARVATAGTNLVQPLHTDPLILGVDVSGGGAAWTVGRYRRGNDARSIPPLRLTGEQTVRDERRLLISRLAESLREHRPDAVFIDAAFGAVVVSELRRLGFPQVFEVNFGDESPDPHYANMRAFMWARAKDWLPTGCVDQNDHRLATDLTKPGFHLDKKDRLVLESKDSMQKRNVASPDDGDALVLTFARPIGPRPQSGTSAARWLPVAPQWHG